MRLKISILTAFFLFQSAIAISGDFREKKFRIEGSTISSRNVRFQFLSPTLVRMEFSPSGKFVDAPTAVVVKRDWKKVKVAVGEKNARLTASARNLTVQYSRDSGKFSKDNLSITWNDSNGTHSWSPGDSDQLNLGGIARSLDGARREKLPRFQSGILSRSGYFVLDDSPTPVWNSDSNWIVNRPEMENQDWYFFRYGNDYPHVLKEYAALCGAIPMIPRYTLGAWVTDLNYEYLPGTDLVEKYRYTDEDVKKMILRLRKEGFPVDVLVLDFAWHKFGWKGGYDWSPIFPNPDAFTSWAGDNGLKVTLNDHPGYARESVLSSEDSRANEVLSQLNIPPPAKPTFSIDIAKDWKFQIDPADTGLEHGWFTGALNDSDWKTLQAGITWEDQGYRDYDGIAWYRKDVTISRDLTFDSLYLTFGGVDDEYDLFLNGRKVAHHGSAGSSVWSSATSTEISSLVTPGEKILIALRVNDWGGGGGLTLTPVVIADVLPPRGIRFNLADKTQAELYMNVLHRPLIDQGVKFWWVDGGSGSCEMEGLNSQMWTNKVFYDFTQQQTGKRSFIFSRSGGWGSHRYPSLFTGDTYSQWEVLAFEIPYTSQGGNVLMPYITHDIGGFIGPNISPDLYVRWVQFGALSPFLRLHSAHENPGEGNRRMPWVFGSRAEVIARSFFQLRYRLIPYIYTYCRLTHDEAMPLVRPLYLEYPSLEQAYRHPEEYFFGKELLVSPVVDSLGEKEIYLPPGAWIDYFSGQALTGDQTIRRSYPLDAFPMFVRSGSIIPMERERDFSDQRPLDTLTIDVYGSPSRFNLYEDDGTSLEYLKGKYAWTPITSSQPGKRATQITIGPTKGNFSGQVTTRSYEVRLHSVPQPRNVTINNRKVNEIREEGQGWRWDSSTSTVSIFVDKTGIGKQINIGVK